ncbi:hypothetical protein [Pseudomonas sp. NGC7]|uniref:hypothetical protein n=1 Tax=Pseudomonas sp. NGC7 TaxID=3341775 RepID=UPI0037DB6E8B
MERTAFKGFIEDQIKIAAKQITDTKMANTHHFAHGKLSFLLSLHRMVDGTATREDRGLHDAINDVLQLLGLVKEKTTYFPKYPSSKQPSGQPLTDRSIENPAQS